MGYNLFKKEEALASAQKRESEYINERETMAR